MRRWAKVLAVVVAVLLALAALGLVLGGDDPSPDEPIFASTPR